MGRSGSGGRGSEAKLGGARDVRSDGQVAAAGGRGEERFEGEGEGVMVYLFPVFVHVYFIKKNL
jgi:hypothetical protein